MMTISKLASAAGVGVETVRFYERKGLIKRPPKGASSFRTYSADDAIRIRFIKQAQELGFTLKEIKEILALTSSSKVTCGDIRGRTDAKLAEIDAKIKALQQMKKSLKKLLSACGDGRKAVEECRILDCFESDWNC